MRYWCAALGRARRSANLAAIAGASAPQDECARDENDRDEHVRPKPWARVAGGEVLGDDHLADVADGVAAVPDDGCDCRGDAEREIAPEGDQAQYADREIGDADFVLKRTHGPTDVGCGYLGEEDV